MNLSDENFNISYFKWQAIYRIACYIYVIYIHTKVSYFFVCANVNFNNTND